MLSSTAAVLVMLATSVAAAKNGRTYAVNHFYGKGPLVEGRMDPIVSPGQTSSHAHTIQGGNAFAETLGDTTLLSSTCTSSLIKNDKSVYWTPKMYFQDPVNGSFEDVPMFYMNVYYYFEATDDDIVPFPVGLRMFVGNPALRTPPATGGAQILDPASGKAIQPVQFTCPRTSYNPPSYPANSDGMHGVGMQDPTNQGAGAGFPDMNCDRYASPLRADIHFPSCYNPAVGLADYKNNMAWPSSAGASGGGKMNCPKGYLHTPHIFYEVYWNTPLFAHRWIQGQGKQPFVLSNGDNTGYSLHADFIAGWDTPTLQQIINNCNAGDSGMDKCPGLIGGINDASKSCNIQSSVNEQINGVLSALPGTNPVTGWGTNGAAPAPPVSSGSPSSSAPAAPASSGAVSSAPGGGAGGGSGAPSASPSIIRSSSATAPVHVQSTPTASGGAPGYTAPASGGGPASSSSSSSSAAAPVYTAPGSGSWSSPAPSSPAVAVNTNTAPGSGSSSGPGSPCAVHTVTTTMTAWITPSSPSGPPPPSGPPSSSPAAGSPTPTNPTLPSSTYAGCYSDTLTGARVLSGITFAYLGPGPNATTTSACVAYCAAEGYTLAGTEYGSQCFCGDALAGSSAKLADGACDMACDGDAGELCGGKLALTVYEAKGWAGLGSGKLKHKREMGRAGRFGRGVGAKGARHGFRY